MLSMKFKLVPKLWYRYRGKKTAILMSSVSRTQVSILEYEDSLGTRLIKWPFIAGHPNKNLSNVTYGSMSSAHLAALFF